MKKEDEHRNTIAFKATDKLNNDLREAAKRKNITISDLIREIVVTWTIEDEMKNHNNTEKK